LGELQGGYYTYKFSAGGVLKKGYEYEFSFYSTFGNIRHAIDFPGEWNKVSGVVRGDIVTYTFTPDMIWI